MRFVCWKLVKCKSCRSDKDRKFEKASGRLYGEIDIVRMISMLRKFDIIKRAQIPDEERQMLSFQRHQVTSSDGDCSPNDYEGFEYGVRNNFDPDLKETERGKEFFKKLEKDLLSFEGKELDKTSLRIIDGLKSKRLVKEKSVEEEQEKRAQIDL